MALPIVHTRLVCHAHVLVDLAVRPVVGDVTHTSVIVVIKAVAAIERNLVDDHFALAVVLAWGPFTRVSFVPTVYSTKSSWTGTPKE